MMVVKVVVALAALAAVALGAGGINADHKFAPVPRELAVAPAGQVIVGLSAGAYFTVQYHMAFSSSLRGAGVIAGGPFYCAADSQTNALVACMSQPELISVGSSVAAAQACAQGGVCDSLDNLSLQRVYLFSGTQDSVVAPGVMVKLEEMYSQFMPNASITTEFSIDAEHSWPTNSYGASCATLGSPYINDCNYDASYAALSAVFGSPLAQPVTANASALHELDQDSYVPGGSASAVSMGPNAYVYAPARCSAVGAQCPLVIAVHGCEQSIDSIGFDFIQYIGLNELAEANGFVVLYPQFIASYFPVTNPNACADWWGYTGSDYANQKGPQMAAVRAMASALANSQSRK